MSEDHFTHLPADVRAALDRYARDVAAGKITFDAASPGAESFPGDAASDQSLARFVQDHIPTEV